MGRDHLIDTAVIDMAFSDNREAYSQHAELNTFVSKTLMRVVDEVFDQFSEDEVVFRIPSLEIDLGEIVFHNYKEDMPKRLRQELIELFKRILHTDKHHIAASNIVIRKTVDETAQLEYFLINGHLPWHSNLRQDQSLEKQLLQLIRSRPSRLRMLVSGAAHKHRVIERIVFQFSESTLARLLEVLVPNAADDIVKYIGHLVAAWTTGRTGTIAGSVPSNDFGRWLWIAAIQSALHDDDRQSNAKSLFGRTLRTVIGERFNIIDTTICEELTRQWAKGKDAGEICRMLDSAVQRAGGDRNRSIDGFVVNNGTSHDRTSSGIIAAIDAGAAPDRHGAPGAKLQGPSAFHEVSELEDDTGTGQTSEVQARKQYLHTYDLYDRLRRALSDTDRTPRFSDVVLEYTIAELSRMYPWQLVRLFSELKAGVILWRTEALALPTDALHQLTLAFLKVINETDSSHQRDMITAIETRALRSSDSRRFYGHVISCLVNNESVDLELIASQIGEHSARGDERQRSGRYTSSTSISSEARPFDNDDNAIATNTHHQSIKHDNGLPQLDSAEARSLLDQYLQTDKTPSQSEVRRLVDVAEHLLVYEAQGTRQWLKATINDNKSLERFIGLLPERLLVLATSLLSAAGSFRLLQCAELITIACYAKEISTAPHNFQHVKWTFILPYLSGSPRAYNENHFIQNYVGHLIEQSPHIEPQVFRCLLAQRLVKGPLPASREMAMRVLDTLKSAHGKQKAIKADVQDTDATTTDEDLDLPFLDEINIANAGLVLTAPYLPRLFTMLELTDNFAFKDHASAVRGLHMLQFLANGSVSSPEHELVLNKVLCGMATTTPVDREISISDHEKEILEGLLQGMIQNWQVLKNTSIAGLRESFLQRHGRLTHRDNAWRLKVAPKAFDMLLDRIPWSYSTIKYPWMNEVIYVQWR